MIPFDASKLRVKHVLLKSCTTALGGSVTIVDRRRSSKNKEVYTRCPVPYAVVRAFIKKQKISVYLKPILVAVTYYGDYAVAMEAQPLGWNNKEEMDGWSSDGSKVNWVSLSERSIKEFLKPLVKIGSWYIDGAYVYRVDQSDLKKAEPISSNGFFRRVQVDSFKLAYLSFIQLASLKTEQRYCLQIVASDGTKALSPPLWKEFSILGRGFSKEELKDNEHPFPFDVIDERLAVNLNFALKAGKKIGELFGFEAIEPLQLDDMMVRLRTVNLPNVMKELKYTLSINMNFTHTIAWLMGLVKRVDTLESYIVLRSLMKYLATKGSFLKSTFDQNAIFAKDMSFDTIPLYNVQEKTTASGQRYLDLIKNEKDDEMYLDHGHFFMP